MTAQNKKIKAELAETNQELYNYMGAYYHLQGMCQHEEVGRKCNKWQAEAIQDELVELWEVARTW